MQRGVQNKKGFTRVDLLFSGKGGIKEAKTTVYLLGMGHILKARGKFALGRAAANMGEKLYRSRFRHRILTANLTLHKCTIWKLDLALGCLGCEKAIHRLGHWPGVCHKSARRSSLSISTPPSPNHCLFHNPKCCPKSSWVLACAFHSGCFSETANQLPKRERERERATEVKRVCSSGLRCQKGR